MQAYNYVRAAGGTGQGNGPFISLHEGFLGLPKWANYLPNADRVALDLHPYLCFGTQSAATMDSYANTPCTAWGAEMNTSMEAFGLTAAGEWSNGVTDCGLWLNGVNLGTRFEGNYTPGTWPRIGSCEPWTNWQAWDQTMKGNIQTFAEASMDALQVRAFNLLIALCVSPYPSHRTGSFGLGRSATHPSVGRLSLQAGHINLA